MFATVAVNATVRGGGTALKTTHIAQESLYPGPVFHYDIPATLSSITVPGALIEVPFGPRQAQGLAATMTIRRNRIIATASASRRCPATMTTTTTTNPSSLAGGGKP